MIGALQGISRRRVLAAVLFVVASGLAGGTLAAEHGTKPDPAAFVESLGERVIAILQEDPSRAERRKRFRELFSNHFDVPAIARFVVGRYWRVATPEQREEYVRLFREYVADLYAGQFSTYSGETFSVTGERRIDDTDTMVKAEIGQSDKPPIKAEFRVRADGELRIVDVVVEGVSLIVTKRSEFEAVLQREGMDGFLDRLRKLVGA